MCVPRYIPSIYKVSKLSLEQDIGKGKWTKKVIDLYLYSEIFKSKVHMERGIQEATRITGKIRSN